MYECLKEKDLGQKLFIPSVTLRHEGDLFLDNMSKDELAQKLNIEIDCLSNDGTEFVDKLVGLVE